MGTAALVMGILQFFCLPVIGSILAVAFGKAGMDRANRGEATNHGTALAGFVIGWVGIGLFLVGFAVGFILMPMLPDILESTMDPAVNAETGLADGTYVMRPDDWFTIGDRCTGYGPVTAVNSSQLVSSMVTLVGVGPACDSVPQAGQVLFTVSGGVATINWVR